MNFDYMFFVLLTIGALGGGLLALIRSVQSYEHNEAKPSLVLLWVLRDIAVGVGLGFACWLGSKLVTNDYAIMLTTFILSLAGVAGFDVFFNRENLKNTLSKVGGVVIEESTVVPPLKQELEKQAKIIENQNLQHEKDKERIHELEKINAILVKEKQLEAQYRQREDRLEEKYRSDASDESVNSSDGVVKKHKKMESKNDE